MTVEGRGEGGGEDGGEAVRCGDVEGLTSQGEDDDDGVMSEGGGERVKGMICPICFVHYLLLSFF